MARCADCHVNMDVIAESTTKGICVDCTTSYAGQKLVLAPSTFIEYAAEDDYSSCDYFQTRGLPDGQRGKCSFGCSQEPICITG